MSRTRIGAIIAATIAALAVLNLWLGGPRNREEARIGETIGRVGPPTERPPMAPDQSAIRVAVEAELPAESSVVEASSPAPATEKELRLRRLVDLLDQFDGKPLEHPPWPGCSRDQLLPIVVMSSIAAVMDAQGTSTIVPQGHTPDILEGGRYDYAFQVGNRDYRFRRGDFPIYEEYNALGLAGARRREAAETVRLDPAAARGPVGDLSIYDDEFCERLSQFAHGVVPFLQ